MRWCGMKEIPRARLNRTTSAARRLAAKRRLPEADYRFNVFHARSKSYFVYFPRLVDFTILYILQFAPRWMFWEHIATLRAVLRLSRSS
jgi:hypothetical protein